MRLAIFFNNNRGYVLLNKLKRKHEICLAILSKKYLNKKITKYLKRLKVPYLITNKINTKKIVNKIKGLNIDLNIVAGFPYIFKKDLIFSAKYNSINLHGGCLPSYRGGSPLNWQIINGERKIYVSIFKMTLNIDKGKLLSEGSFKLEKKDNITNVKKKSDKLFTKLIDKAISNLLKRKTINSKTKKSNKYYKQRKKSDSFINFNNSTALEVYNKFRACEYPYEAFYKKNGKKFKIKVLKIIKNPNKLKKFENKIFECKKNFVLVNYSK